MGTQKLFFSAATLAKKTLVIMTPYFIPGPEYVNLLCLAASRGVEVKIIVPRNTDHPFVAAASRSAYPKLLAAGVKIYEKMGVFSHIKALLVDNEWGFMGSSNCDQRSFRLNFELDFVYEESDFVKTMVNQLKLEESQSAKITLHDVEKKSPVKRLIENTCALFSPLL